MAKAAPIAFGFFVLAIVGTVFSFSIVRTVILKEGKQRFDILTKELSSVVMSRINRTIDLPVTLAHGINPKATKDSINSYISSLDIESRYPSVREVGIYGSTGTSTNRLYRYTVANGSVLADDASLRAADGAKNIAGDQEPFLFRLADNQPNYIVIVPMGGNYSLYIVFDSTIIMSRLYADNSMFNSVNFRIYDSTDPNYSLFESSTEVYSPSRNAYTATQQINVGLYPWILVANSNPEQLMESTANNMPYIILVAGITIAVLMFGILFALSWSRKSALVLAENITRNLRISEEKYRNIFESLQDVYYRTDRDGTITTVSPSVEHYIGLSPEQLIGKNASSFYKNPTQRNGMLTELAKHGIVKDYPITLVGRNGNILFCSLNARMVTDVHGTISGVEGVIRDVSERKRAEDSLVMRTKELERLNSLMVNRELRMVELKKEIAALSAQLQKKNTTYGKD